MPARRSADSLRLSRRRPPNSWACSTSCGSTPTLPPVVGRLRLSSGQDAGGELCRRCGHQLRAFVDEGRDAIELAKLSLHGAAHHEAGVVDGVGVGHAGLGAAEFGQVGTHFSRFSIFSSSFMGGPFRLDWRKWPVARFQPSPLPTPWRPALRLPVSVICRARKPGNMPCACRPRTRLSVRASV